MDYEREIIKRIENIEKKQEEILQSVHELVGAWPYICRRIEKMETTLYGNGNGLVSRMAVVAVVSYAVVGVVASLVTAYLTRML